MPSPEVLIQIRSVGGDAVRREIQGLKAEAGQVASGNQQMATSARAAAKEHRDQANAIAQAQKNLARLTADLSGADAATRRYQTQVATLNAAQKAGAISATEYAKTLDLITQRYKEAQASASNQQMARSARDLMSANQAQAAALVRAEKEQVKAQAVASREAERAAQVQATALSRAQAGYVALQSTLRNVTPEMRAQEVAMGQLNAAYKAGLVSEVGYLVNQRLIASQFKASTGAVRGLKQELESLRTTLPGVIAAQAALSAGGGLGTSLLASRIGAHLGGAVGLPLLGAGAAAGALGYAGYRGQQQQLQEAQFAALGSPGARSQLVGLGLEFGDLQGAIDQFKRLAIVRQDLGVSTEQMVGFERRLYEVLRLQGGVTGEATSGLIQLTQALSSGQFQGDEFRSVMENIPIVARAIAKGLIEMGVATTGSIGELRQLSKEGELTSERVFKAFLIGSKEMSDAAQGLPRTIGMSLSTIGSAFLEIAGDIGRATGMTPLIEGMFSAIASGAEAAALGLGKATEAWLRWINRPGVSSQGITAGKGGIPSSVAAVTEQRRQDEATAAAFRAREALGLRGGQETPSIPVPAGRKPFLYELGLGPDEGRQRAAAAQLLNEEIAKSTEKMADRVDTAAKRAHDQFIEMLDVLAPTPGRIRFADIPQVATQQQLGMAGNPPMNTQLAQLRRQDEGNIAEATAMAGTIQNQKLADSYNMVGAAAATASQTIASGMARAITTAGSLNDALLGIIQSLSEAFIQGGLQYLIGSAGTATAGPGGTTVTGASGLLGMIFGASATAQHGMNFTVPGAGGEDRHLFQTRLHGGEVVDITSAREARMAREGGGGGAQTTINVDARQADPGTAAASINAALRLAPAVVMNAQTRGLVRSDKRPPF